ncbi:MAG: hypothetical protein M1828_007375 [Chrysothrix sp. TS-e1954]|nr:MAG: hypothetical protein M1828_007375 [Chrysothrix sp. TS-e1954]
MAPGQKRKRGDRTSSYDNNDAQNRPSPHHPGGLNLAQEGPHSPRHQIQNGYGHRPEPNRGRGGRRGARGGRGYHQGPPVREHRNEEGSVDQESSANDHQLLSRASQSQVDAAPPSQPEKHLEMTHTDPRPTPTAATDEAPANFSAPNVPSNPLPVDAPSIFLSGPFHYDFLTRDTLQAWQESGKSSLIQAASAALAADDYMKTSLIFQELLRASHDQNLDPSEAGKAVQEILALAPSEGTFDAPTSFLDTLSVFTHSDVSSPYIRQTVLSTGISATLMREVLDDVMLQALGLIRPTFGRVMIRKQTNIFYRQSNYNLLREESEGFSKLMTELFTTTNNEPPTEEVVVETFEKVKALIGAFDLDAGRVLDVTLDVFASLLVKHYRFFVKFLRCSSYWPHQQSDSPDESSAIDVMPCWARPGHSHWTSNETEKHDAFAAKSARDHQFWERAREIGMTAFFELGGRQLRTEQERADYLNKSQQIDDAHMNETVEWINITQTLPPLGNPVAAQLLGFKLRFYASAARDSNDSLPVNLVYLAALLIKTGFISLRDLYTHLYPEDDSMEAVKTKQMQEQQERENAKRPGARVPNALARAGALVDDTLPAAPVSRLREPQTGAATPTKQETADSRASTPLPKSSDDASQEQLPEPADQKVQLLRSLLCIGAMPEALYMLSRFPWLPDAFPDLPEHLNRILHYSLDQLYESVSSVDEDSSIRETSHVASSDQGSLLKGHVRLAETSASKVLRWAQLDRNDTNEGIDYKFYWDDWSDNVPACQTVDDVFTLCNTLMNYSGVKIGQDSKLLMKLARIGKYSLGHDHSESNKAIWFDLLKRLMCPALSMTESNPGIVNEVFELLRHYPTKARYSLYAEWFQGSTTRLPDMANAFNLVRIQTKDVLKKITKTNTKQMARALAKAACASPGIVFETVFTQIESYDNLIDVVVECGRYFTYMGYDVLTWSLMSFLGKQGRSRLSKTGLATSGWLQSLALFTGRIFKRYSLMNPLPVLQYILHQLRHDNVSDLIILREIMTNMVGVSPDTDFTDAQVLAMAGGEVLQNLTLKQLHDRRHESRTSSKRLTRTLVDNDLTSSFLISIAQQRQTCIFNSEGQSTKFISEKFDEVHLLLIQYLDMLATHLPIEEFRRLIPNATSLIADYGIDASVALMTHRRSIDRAMADYDAIHKTALKPARPSVAEAAEPLQLDNVVKIEHSSANIEVDPETVEHIDETMRDVEDALPVLSNDTVVLDRAQENVAEVSAASHTLWHPVLSELMEEVKAVLPSSFKDSLSVSFFVTFWQLSLSDIMAPSGSYDNEIKRQKDRLSTINSDRSDVSISGLKKKDAERKTANDTLEQLSAEMGAHVKNYQVIRRRLEKEKEYWFKDYEKKSHTLNLAILQECFLPRMLLSPLDSYYTQKMLFLLHSVGAPGFRTMHFLDRLFVESTLTNIIFQCTGRESENFGRFLKEVLKVLSEWHQDRAVYEKRAYGAKKDLTGFAQEVSPDGKPERFLDFEDFRRLLYKWHRNLFDCVKACITSGEYMHVKNTINIVRSVSKYFPAINFMGTSLFKVGEELVKSEKPPGKGEPEKPLHRPDLWVAMNSLLGSLKQYEKSWQMPQAFRQGSNDGVQKTPKPSSDDLAEVAKPEQAQSTSVGSLNALAPDFRPKKSADIVTGEPQTTLKGAGNSLPEAANIPADSVRRESSRSRQAQPQTSTVSGSLKEETSHVSVPANAGVKTMPDSAERFTNGESGARIEHGGASVPAKPHLPNPPASDASRGRSTLPPKPEPRRNLRNGPVAGGLPGRVTMPPRETGMERLPAHSISRTQSSGDSIINDGHDRVTVEGDAPLYRKDGPRDGLRTNERADRRRSDARGMEPSRDFHSDMPRQSRPEVPERMVRAGPPQRGGQDDGPSRRSDQDSMLNPERASLIQQVQIPPAIGAAGSNAYERNQDRPGAPDGPRNPRGPPRSGFAGPDGPRHPESMQPPPFSRSGFERGPGRLNQDMTRPAPHQDPSYGRLNAETASPASPPARPQDRRDASTSQSTRQDHQYGGSGPPTPTTRQPERSARYPPNGSNSSPATPLVDPPVQDTSGVHPSRLRQIESDKRPPPLHTGAQVLQTSSAHASPTGAPSGPRSAQSRDNAGASSASLGPSHGPPSGPSSRNLGGARRQFAGLQEQLHQGGQQSPSSSSPSQPRPAADTRPNDLGTSIRGRASNVPPRPMPANPYSGSGSNGASNAQPGPRPMSSRGPPNPIDIHSRAPLPPDPYPPQLAGRHEREFGPSFRAEVMDRGREQEREDHSRQREPRYTSERDQGRGPHEPARPPHDPRNDLQPPPYTQPEQTRDNRPVPSPRPGRERDHDRQPREREHYDEAARDRGPPRHMPRETGPPLRNREPQTAPDMRLAPRHREPERENREPSQREPRRSGRGRAEEPYPESYPAPYPPNTRNERRDAPPGAGRDRDIRDERGAGGSMRDTNTRKRGHPSDMVGMGENKRLRRSG